MANLRRSNRDRNPFETTPERLERTKQLREAELARIAKHVAEQAELAKLRAAQRRKGR